MEVSHSGCIERFSPIKCNLALEDITEHMREIYQTTGTSLARDNF